MRNYEEVTPITGLMSGRLLLPPRTCRTGLRGSRWSWKRLYLSEQEAKESAFRSGVRGWYLCPNCEFWHVGHQR